MAALIDSGYCVEIENSRAADHKYIIQLRHNLAKRVSE